MDAVEFPKALEPAYLLGEAMLEALVSLARRSNKKLRGQPREGRGRTLRPGSGTPLWNQFRRQLRPHLRRYGSQVNLGRELELPRQRINDFVTRGGRMPDAERTLELLVWLSLQRQSPRRSRRTWPRKSPAETD